MKKIIFISIFALFLFSSCEDANEEQSVDLTVAEAKEMVSDAGSSLSDDIISLVESNGVQQLSHIADLLAEHGIVAGRKSQQAWTKERLEIIKQHFVDGPSARVGSSSPSTLEDIKGHYIWNFEKEEFDFEASDFFIVSFPAKNSLSNNAVFRITALEYETVTSTDMLRETTAPSVINMDLNVDDQIVVELSYKVSWSASGTPDKAEVELFVDPFTFSINFIDTFSNSTSLLTSVSLDEEIIVAIDVDVEYETESKEDPFFIDGNVQYRGLKVDGTVDARKIGIDADPNDFIELTLFSGDNKVGDILFVLEEIDGGGTDYVPYVEHSDGTLQNLEEVLNPAFEEIESILKEFAE